MHIRSLTRRISIGVLIILLLVGVVLHGYARYVFASAYGEYAQAAKRHDDSAYIPAVADNSLRKELNDVLVRVLAQEMTDQERLSLARRGQALLEAAEVQIDAIGEAGSDVMSTMQKMEQATDVPGALYKADDMDAIIELSKERFNIIGDIRGLSYRAQFTTGQIFKQIIDDGGALDPVYVASLNRELPDIEEQYNKRTNFYTELEAVSLAITKKYAAFKSVF